MMNLQDFRLYNSEYETEIPVDSYETAFKIVGVLLDTYNAMGFIVGAKMEVVPVELLAVQGLSAELTFITSKQLEDHEILNLIKDAWGKVMIKLSTGLPPAKWLFVRYRFYKPVETKESEQ